jgi:hypothetical protein
MQSTYNIKQLKKWGHLRAKRSLPSKFNNFLWNGRSKKHITKRGVMRAIRKQLYSRKIDLASLTKEELIGLSEFHKGIVNVQRLFRKSRVPTNTVCPISLEPLIKPVFIHRNATGFKRGYNLKVLAEYFLSCGKTVDPVDKQPYSKQTLVEMDKMLQRNNIILKPLSKINTEAEQKKYRLEKERLEEIQVLQDDIEDILWPKVLDTITFCVNLSFFLSSEHRSLVLFQNSCVRLRYLSVSEFAKTLEICRQSFFDEDEGLTEAHIEYLQIYLSTMHDANIIEYGNWRFSDDNEDSIFIPATIFSETIEVARNNIRRFTANRVRVESEDELMNFTSSLFTEFT